MTTIRRRLTIWYTVALGATILAFGVLLYLDQRQSSLRDLDQRLKLQADLAEHRLSEAYRTRRTVTTQIEGRPALIPDLASDLEGLPDRVEQWALTEELADREFSDRQHQLGLQ